VDTAADVRLASAQSRLEIIVNGMSVHQERLAD
jgi:hypothetical protein